MTQGDKPNQELPNSIVTVLQEDDGSLKTNSSIGENVIKNSEVEKPQEPKSNKRKRGEGAVQKPEASAKFSIDFIQIDSWKRGIVRYPGDMQFKCYFKNKRFLWEVMDGETLKKVEYLWDDLQLISFNEERGELQIMIKKKPSFFYEQGFVPNKHPRWVNTEDFIFGLASSTPIHVLTFPPRIYVKLYKRITAVAQVNSDLKKLIWSGQKTELQRTELAPNHIPYARSQIPYHPLTLPQTSDAPPSRIITFEELQRYYTSHPDPFINLCQVRRINEECSPPSSYQRPYQAQAINTHGQNHGNLMFNHNPAADYYSNLRSAATGVNWTYKQDGAICANGNGSSVSPPINGGHTSASFPDGNCQINQFLPLSNLCENNGNPQYLLFNTTE